MGPRLDTGGWLALTETPYGLSSRQGLSPCKIRRAFPGAITVSFEELWKGDLFVAPSDIKKKSSVRSDL